jgi:hypothetical protein
MKKEATSMRMLVCTALLLLAGCASDSAFRGQSRYEMGRDEYGPVPLADPTRTISDQNCTRLIEMDGGNLRCR